MSSRIRTLEAAVAAFQASKTSEQHPLLRDSLLLIASTADIQGPEGSTEASEEAIRMYNDEDGTVDMLDDRVMPIREVHQCAVYLRSYLDCSFFSHLLRKLPPRQPLFAGLKAFQC